jgi:hypothetical protein
MKIINCQLLIDELLNLLKRMFKSRILLFVSIILALFGCTYFPEEEKFFVEVSKKLPEFTISLNDYDNNDTIFVFQPSVFKFNLTVKDVVLKKVDVLLGSNVIATTTTPSGTFSIANGNLKTGIFELRIQFTSNSGTGSLADKTGQEELTIWRKWVVNIDVSPPPKPILSAAKTNGFLTITWPPFNKKNFKNYQLFIRRGYEETRTYTDRRRNFYVDSSYVGGEPVGYWLQVNTISSYSASDEKVIFEPQNVRISYRSVDSSALITWRKVKYDGALKEIVLTENDILKKTILASSDTTFTLKLTDVLFGANSTIGWKLSQKYPYKNQSPLTSSIIVDNPVGAKRVQPYQNLFYNKTLNTIMSYSGTFGLLRVYDTNMKIIDSMQMSSNYSIPYPGRYVYYPQSGGVVQQDIITKSTKSFPTKSFYSPSITPNRVSGADNGLIAYDYFDRTYPWDVLYGWGVGNIKTLAIYSQGDISYDPKVNVILPLNISDDGRYVMRGGSISDSQTNVAISYLPGTVYEFRPDNNDEVIYLGSPTTILKTSDKTLLRTLTPPEPGYTRGNYDTGSKNILYTKYQAKKIYLINIDDQRVTSINACGSCISTLVNGLLFDGRGYYVKVL